MISATKTLDSDIKNTNENDATKQHDEDVTDNDDDVFDQFLMACSQGEMNIVVELINKHPEYVIGYSKNGESCLHVAGILGQSNVTQYILNHGGNPNQRSLNQHGLRMTPLSWNVYGNHIENVKLLLKAGADINLDFDYIVKDGKYEKVTVLDLLYVIGNFDNKESSQTSSDDKREYQQKQYDMRDLLLQHGAKRYSELEQQKEDL